MPARRLRPPCPVVPHARYLRKALIPRHKDLRFAGLLNPLDTPHHMRMSEEARFREGVVLARPTKSGHGSFVNVGLLRECQIDRQIVPGVRVTVEIDTDRSGKKCESEWAGNVLVAVTRCAAAGSGRPSMSLTECISPRALGPLLHGRRAALRGKAVAPSKPREALGVYWGYTVRVAGSLGEVFSKCPFEGGYDVTLGTSERGTTSVDDKDFAIPTFK